MVQPPAHAAPQMRATAGSQAQALPGEAVVKLKAGTRAQAFAKQYGLTLRYAVGHDMYVFTGVPEVGAFRGDAAVTWAEPNRRFDAPPVTEVKAPTTRMRAAEGGPNDPLLPAQYGVFITGADKAWKKQEGASSVVVAVIDSGIDGNHPEFAGQLVPGWDTTLKVPGPGGDHDGYGHGTHCAGVIAAKADNGVGVAGIAHGCKLMPVRIFDDFGHSETGRAAAAVLWAVDHGAKVISASWGSPDPGQAQNDAVQYAMDHDVVFVSAVGNSGSNDTKYYPGAQPGVIGVAATTDIDTWGPFSTWGDWVSLGAPGKGILSTFPLAKCNGYRIMEGTSMACPLVAAAAALVRSEFPQLTQAQVKARLEATAKDVIQPGKDPYCGNGRVDIGRAVLDPLSL
jgi:subtilisin family serine protease